jgi:hypothetical protein
MKSLHYVATLALLSTAIVASPGCQRADVSVVAEANADVWPQELPAPDYLDLLIAREGTAELKDRLPPRSLWVESQKAAFAATLARTKADLLIAPFQTQGYGLDRIERAIMTADLAYELGRSVSVADPFLVARALGEGRRRFEHESILRLAQSVGAQKVVVPYVGHGRDHHMTITIGVFEVEPPGASSQVAPSTRKDWRSIEFSDADPPYSVFHRMLPDVLRELSLASDSSDQNSAVAAVTFPSAVTESFARMAAMDSSAIPGSVGLALLGTLAPIAGAVTRERLFERAYVTSLHFDGPGPQTDFLRAYILTNLQRRPAALALIQDSSRPADVVLRAVLNGDLPSATTGLAALPNGLERFFLAIQLNDMRLYYGKQGEPPLAEAVAVFGQDISEWHALVEWRSFDLDQWQVEPAVGLKYLMDEVFPVPGLDARTLLEGGNVVGPSVDDITIDTTTARHVRRFVETASTVPCCTATSAMPNAWDLVFLLEGRGEARIAKELNRLVNVQGLPEQAARAFARYDDLLSGHPDIAAMHAEFSIQSAHAAMNDMRQTWRERARQDSLVAAFWSPGQNMTSLRALIALGIPSDMSSAFVDAYGFDYPRQSFWPDWFFGVMQQSNIREALWREGDAHNQTDLESLAMRVSGVPPERQTELASELRFRFVGHPKRNNVLAALSPPDSAPTNALELQRAALAEDPDNWQAYMDLADLLISRDGNYAEAADILMSYPRFQEEPDRDRVPISNMAYHAGSLFYSRAAFDLARPFFEISAGLETGSEPSMTSSVRLWVMESNYFAAAEELGWRAERYPSAYSYGDYFSFLHALGSGEDAWNGFAQFAAAFDGADVWYSALVGHRREGMTQEKLRAWLRQPQIRDARFRSQRFALGYAILFNATDRIPPADLGELVAELEGAPEARIDEDGYSLARPHPLDPSQVELLSPSTFRAVERPPVGTPIKSDLAYFAAAFADLRHGNFAEAVEGFIAMADYYPIDRYTHSFVLPYFAQAAAETGDAIGLERFLEQLEGAGESFDNLLAQAFFAGARDETDEALALVEKAFRYRPAIWTRPVFSTYQYAEACEWLYAKTEDPRFLDLLLDFAAKRQTMQPTDAWAYALEYAYTHNDERRTRALAMTMYLDPLSTRIKGATPTEQDKARAWGNENNPFLRSREPADEQLVVGLNPLL